MCDEFKEIDILEKKLGFSIDKVFFENLALHTQVCKKKIKIKLSAWTYTLFVFEKFY